MRTIKQFVVAAGVAVAMLASAGAASAATLLGGCNITDIVGAPAGSSCYGYFAGAVVGSSPADLTDQTTALNALGLPGAQTATSKVETLVLNNNPIINFAAPLNGPTWIAVHWGAGAGGPGVGVRGGVTGFYFLNLAPNANLDTISTNFATTNSTAVLFGTSVGVPEPATWAMMILGFGSAGAMIRRRRALTAA
jgi:PEP-CTERM motif